MDTYVQAVSIQVNNSSNSSPRTHDNLPREERQALNSLRQRTNIIIKPADKRLLYWPTNFIDTLSYEPKSLPY